MVDKDKKYIILYRKGYDEDNDYTFIEYEPNKWFLNYIDKMIIEKAEEWNHTPQDGYSLFYILRKSTEPLRKLNGGPWAIVCEKTAIEMSHILFPLSREIKVLKGASKRLFIRYINYKSMEEQLTNIHTLWEEETWGVELI